MGGRRRGRGARRGCGGRARVAARPAERGEAGARCRREAPSPFAPFRPTSPPPSAQPFQRPPPAPLFPSPSPAVLAAVLARAAPNAGTRGSTRTRAAASRGAGAWEDRARGDAGSGSGGRPARSRSTWIRGAPQGGGKGTWLWEQLLPPGAHLGGQPVHLPLANQPSLACTSIRACVGGLCPRRPARLGAKSSVGTDSVVLLLALPPWALLKLLKRQVLAVPPSLPGSEG